MHEIERKFLVTAPLSEIIKKHAITARKRIEQRYLDGKTGDWTIRARKVTHQPLAVVEHFFTMKKKVTMIRCVEIETKIDRVFYESLLSQCGAVLTKMRHCIKVGDHIWEIDVFDDFDGLIIAEIELRDEAEAFVRPDWLGIEVTEDKQYKNRQMVKTLEKRAL